MPVAIAPDETRITSEPRPWAAASASTSAPIWPTFSPETEDDPTFTTMRRACGISAREVTTLLTVLFLGDRESFVISPDAGVALGLEFGAGGGLRIHSLEVALAACPVGRALVVVEA